MKLICELNDLIVLGLDGTSTKPPRLTARAIVKNPDGLYAVMYADKFHLYTLPGGGVEAGEDVLTALKREVWEETGCACTHIEELGCVMENRASLDYTQENYYYVVTVEKASAENHLTDTERSNRTEVQWHSLADAYHLITEPIQDTVQRKYLQARDKAALDAYLKCRLKNNC